MASAMRGDGHAAAAALWRSHNVRQKMSETNLKRETA
jgi:hypothetical protein